MLRNNTTKRTQHAVHHFDFYFHLTYGILAWATLDDGRVIVVLHKKAVRVLSGLSPQFHCRNIFVTFTFSHYILEADVL